MMKHKVQMFWLLLMLCKFMICLWFRLIQAREETFGNAAVPGRVDSAKRAIDEAAEIADRVNANAIHVLAGCVEGEAARKTFISNLGYAIDNSGKTILIEPISEKAVPGYFLNSIHQAGSILEEISDPRLKIMFDCFHIRHEVNDVEKIFREYAEDIGHVQISSFPARNEPFDGEIGYSNLLFAMKSTGYGGFFGCEYNPRGEIISGLDFRIVLRDSYRAAIHTIPMNYLTRC